MQSDFEIAMALQMEEGTAAAEAMQMQQAVAHDGAPRDPPRDPPRWVLFVVEPSTTNARCNACGGTLQRQATRVLFQRPGQRRLNSVHVDCLHAVPGLVRPSCAPPLPRRSRAPLAEGAVLYHNHLSSAERRDVQATLESLPASPAAVQCFEWPQPPRQPSRRVELHRQLMFNDRDFTPEDYEMLLQLDRGSGGSRVSHQEREEQAQRTQTLLERLPVSRLKEAAAGERCSICLEDLAAGAEVRTLPCMHVFHRKCIDKWLTTSGNRPRCPIDQVEVQA